MERREKMKEAMLGMLLAILSSSMLFSAFSVQSVKGEGTIYINADGSISPPEAPVSSFDNMTYTLTANVDSSILVERSNIVVDGAGYTVQGDGSGNGFALQDVVNVTVRNTRIEGCFDGIRLFNSSYNVITGNAIFGNNYEGVGVYYSSDNIIAGNDIIDNQVGIEFYSSSYNSVIHNNLVNHTLQVYTENSVSAWDNGCEGNYWSDYNGTDVNGDGIGDTPYVIDENNIDRYPLMHVYWNPADINHNLRVDMKDVAIAAKAFGTIPGDPRWNPRADITGLLPFVPDGKVDMRDISVVAKNFGKTYL